MDRLREYKIAFRGLGEGKHTFRFQLDNAFFDCFEATKGVEGEVDAQVIICKTSLTMEVVISLSGEVKALCDRCLGELTLPVEGTMNLIVKQNAREEGNDDDYIVLAPEDDFLDLSPYLYEVYMLNYPIRVVHADGECDPDMQQVLSGYVMEEKQEETIDPRWEELRKLINN